MPPYHADERGRTDMARNKRPKMPPFVTFHAPRAISPNSPEDAPDGRLQKSRKNFGAWKHDDAAKSNCDRSEEVDFVRHCGHVNEYSPMIPDFKLESL